jgi:TetR/AcrR family transcriptional regulator, transcriptional repressor for nem operon
MAKGDQTKEMILHQAAQLFNRRGFFGSAMSDIMDVTGLEKGGIYNHFVSKEDLALQAFDYTVDVLRQEIKNAIADKKNAVDRLIGLIGFYQREAEGYPFPGGCPVMNTAIEADDTQPALRERAKTAMEEWHQFIRRIVQRGKEKGEIRADVDGEMLSSVFISVMEGAIMQSRLYGNLRPMNHAVEYLTDYLEREVRA